MLRLARAPPRPCRCRAAAQETVVTGALHRQHRADRRPSTARSSSSSARSAATAPIAGRRRAARHHHHHQGAAARGHGAPQGAALRHLGEHRDRSPCGRRRASTPIATTRPLDELLAETERLRYQIGMDQAVRRVGGTTDRGRRPLHRGADPAQARRTAATQQLDDEVLGRRGHAVPDPDRDAGEPGRGRLRGRVLPGARPRGHQLRRDASSASRRPASSAGSTTSRATSRWLYGLLSVALALVAGWLAAAAFRLARR